MIVLKIINLQQHLIQLPLPLPQKVNFFLYYIYYDKLRKFAYKNNIKYDVITIKENWSRSMKSPKPMNGLQDGLKGNVDQNSKSNGLFTIFI